MLRRFQLALLTACILTGSALGQRNTFRGNTSAPHSPAGVFVHHGFSNRFSAGRFSHGHEGLGILVPYYEPYEYEQPYETAFPSGPAPLVLIQQHDEGQSPAREAPLVKPRTIDVPGQNNSVAARLVPPTVFILRNGERLESRRFVLTTSTLSLSVGRHQRVIPVAMLDIDATVAANREREIDLHIPVDPSEISLSF